VNLTACAGLPRTPENPVNPTYSSAALGSVHTKGTRSRFNPGPLPPNAAQFEILYFAEDHLTALFGFRAMVGSPLPGRAISNPAVSALVLNVQITLQEVFDLTQVRSAQMPLQTTAQELTGDWDGYQSRSMMTSVTAPTGIAETQHLGQTLFQTGVEGFRSISAKVPYTRTLVVFPTQLRRGSSIIHIDNRGAVVHQIHGTI
jgi:RES domain